MTGARIAVLDYGIGNLRSAEKALQHVGAAAHLVRDPDEAAAAPAVVLPGVGDFGACARALRRTGLEAAARHALDRGVPFLGICVGFQLLYEGSEESPSVEGLGVLAGTVQHLPAGVKHPQMQWNPLRRTPGQPGRVAPDRIAPDRDQDGRDQDGRDEDGRDQDNRDLDNRDLDNRDQDNRVPGLLAGLDDPAWVYFLHSYAPAVGAETVAVCDYGGPVAAAAERGAVWGVQFHPEKSGAVGLAILANFAARCSATAA